MKRIFLSVGMAALMLVAGTNVYLANQTNSSVTLNLLDVEHTAEGESNAVPPWLAAAVPVAEVVGAVAAVVALGYVIYDHCTSSEEGHFVLVRANEWKQNGEKHGYKEYTCLPGGTGCVVGGGPYVINY